MTILIVVENRKLWPHEIPGAEIVRARDYLTDPRFTGLNRAKVFNLCKAYGYQTLGYYVSLLAAARGHKPLPSVTTIQDLRQSALLRIASDGIRAELNQALAPVKAPRFELSIYFGRNMARRYDRLSGAIFGHFPAPFLRAEFVHVDEWRLNSLRPIGWAEIPEFHRSFVMEQTERFFARPRISDPDEFRYDIAILVNSEENDPPSDERALQKFEKAARELNMRPWRIGKGDYGRLAEFDALFIRETTQVNHPTYRFASRAEAEGLVVMDDPESIVRCTNKVYQAELFAKNGIPCPKTLIVHKDNRDEVGKVLGFPCVLKRPDSSFSAGVEKAENQAELEKHLDAFFDKSELVVAQEFVPSSFDWRVGVLDGKALYACKYHMVKGAWKIQTHGKRMRYGEVDTIPMEQAPPKAVEIAVKSARLIGHGLYGVDVKEVDDRFLVMEINDNPSIEAGYEDTVLKDELYMAIMRSFYDRLEQRGAQTSSGNGSRAPNAS
jgi:glutathione synthase/RimK-type ligase-like ATP-grasp enzyme